MEADVPARLRHLEAQVADLQHRLDSVTKEQCVQPPAGACEAPMSGEIQMRLKSLEESLASDRASNEGRLQAMSAEFQENVSELLQQVEQGLSAVEEATALQTQQTEAALQGLIKRVEDNISNSATELSDAALENILSQADKVITQRGLLKSALADGNGPVFQMVPGSMMADYDQQGMVIRQQSQASATAAAYAVNQIVQVAPSGTSSGPSAINSPDGPQTSRSSGRAMSPAAGGRTMVPVVSMPTLRPGQGAMSPSMPVIKATPRLTSRPGPPQTFHGRCSSPDLSLSAANSPSVEVFSRGRSTEPQTGRGDMTSRSPDQRYLSMRAPVVVGPQRSVQTPPLLGLPRSPAPPMTGATSPPVTHRTLPRSPFGGIVPQSPRASVPPVEPPGQWVRQPPAALRKPFPHR